MDEKMVWLWMKKLEIENDGIQNEENESSTYIYISKRV